MQRQFAFALLIFAVFLLGSIASLGAQDAPVQGFYFATTTEGTLEETGDDTYLLTLEGVPPLLDWVVSQPEYFAGGYETAVFAAEWSANEETPLTATAMLRLEEVTLRFTAGAPTYDQLSGTFTFEVSAVEAFPIEEDDKKKGGDIPDEFDAGTLTIVVDAAFDAGLTLGGEILDAEGRVSRSNQSQRPGPPRAKP